jgi:hypothetical protein
VIKSISDALGHQPVSMVIRSLAIASLFRRQVKKLPDYSVLLNLMKSSADVSVLDRDRITFTRSIHLTPREDGSVDVGHLADEIRLTLVVAPRPEMADGESDREIEHVYMFADLNGDSHFVEQLADELQLTVSLLDPLVGVELPRGDRPERTHRFAALIGIVWDHLGTGAPLDFANPKQPPRAPRVRQKTIVYGTAVLLITGFVGTLLKNDVDQAQQRAEVLANEVALQQQLLKKIRSKTSVLDSVENWERAQVNWLEELRTLSDRFPAADQAVVQRMTMAPSSGTRGLISMSVRVRDPALIADLENSLRDPVHQVSSQRISQSGGGNEFACQFETSVIVTPTAAAQQQQQQQHANLPPSTLTRRQ